MSKLRHPTPVQTTKCQQWTTRASRTKGRNMQNSANNHSQHLCILEKKRFENSNDKNANNVTPLLQATSRGLCFANKDKDGVTYFLSRKGVTCGDWWVNPPMGCHPASPHHFAISAPFESFLFYFQSARPFGWFEIRRNCNSRKFDFQCFNHHVLHISCEFSEES